MSQPLPCDNVFDLLTQPEPIVDSGLQQVVTLHLQACHECRQLAQAVRPSVALLQQVARDDVIRHELGGWTTQPGSAANRTVGSIGNAPWLPGNPAVVADQLDATAQPAAAELDGRHHGLTTRPAWALVALTVVSIVMAVVSLAFALRSAPPPMNLSKPVVPPSAAQLAALSLPAACLGQPGTSPDATPEGVTQQCCTKCHASSGEQRLATDTSWQQLLVACSSCHH